MLSKQTPPHIVTLVLIASVGALPMNVFLPALPAIAHDFGTDYTTVQLMISLYMASIAVLQLFIGPASDRYGRRPVLICCFSIFLLASVVAIYAPNITVLLTARVVQGTAAAGMVLSRAIVRDTVGPAEAASKIGYVTMGMSVVPMIAPGIGGIFTEFYAWQSTFVIMVVHSGLVLVLVYFDLGETNKHRSTSFTAQFRNYPELVRLPAFWGYALASAFTTGIFFAFVGGGPFIASEQLNLSPSHYGIYYGLISLGYMIGNFIAGRISPRQGLIWMIQAGSLISALGILMAIALVLMGALHPLALFGSVLFVCIGNGMTQPNANAGLVSVKPHLAGSASGLGGALQMGVGGLMATLASAVLSGDGTSLPMLLVMLGSNLLAIAAAMLVYAEKHKSNA